MKRAIKKLFQPGDLLKPFGVALTILFFTANTRAAIVQRGTATTAVNSSTSSAAVSINKPTGVVSNDVMFATIATYNSGTAGVSAPAGWTLLKSGTLGGTGATNFGAIYYRVAGGSEGSSYTFTLTGSGSFYGVGAIVAFSGVNPATPIDANGSAFTLSSGSSSSVTAGAITTTTANTYAIMFGMGARSSSGSPSWGSWTSPLAELFDYPATGFPSVGAAGKAMATAGSTGSGAASLGRSMFNGAIWVALKPAVNVSAGNSTVSASPTSVTADGVSNATITVTLKDDNTGAVVPNKTVTLAKISGPGTPSIATIQGTTDASGIATFNVASTTAGTNVFRATDATDGINMTQTASVIFAAGPATANNSTVSVAPGSVPADGVSVCTITVMLLDANTNLVSGKTVTLASDRGVSDTISPASGISSGSGAVSFTVKSLTPGSPNFTATDTSDSVVVTQTATMTFIPAAAVDATNSTVVASPTTIPADGATASTITVTLKDSSGIPVAGETVTLTNLSGPGSPTINTIQGMTDTNGIALFTVASVTAGTNIFQATDASDSIVILQTASVIFASAPTKLSFVSVPATGVAGTPFSVTVQAQDAGGNPANVGTTTTVLLSKATGTGALSGTLTGIIGVGSNAVTISTPVYNKAETMTLTATASGGPALTSATSSEIIFFPGIASGTISTISSAPNSVIADGAASSTVIVTLLDANSNAVPGKVITLSKISGPGSPVITAIQPTTDTNGVAMFTAQSTTSGTNVFQATDTTDAIVITRNASVIFAVGPVSAGVSKVMASPSSVLADGVASSTITVTLLDANSNAVPNKIVALASSRGAADTITPSSGTSSGLGLVTFTAKSVTVGSPVFTATDNTDGIALSQTPTVNFFGSTNKDILVFGTNVFASTAVIDTNAGTIAWTVPFGTAVSNLAPNYAISAFASGVPVSGTMLDFRTPQSYTITAQDGSAEIYTVTVFIAPARADKDILNFGSNYAGSTAVINTNAATILWTLPAGTLLNSLAPTYTLPLFASGSPPSGSNLNFTAAQIYAITAQDGSTKNFTVTASNAIGPQTYGISSDTDLAQEFSPMNKSGHPVITGLNNYPNSATPKALGTAALKSPWNVNAGSQTMLCSDCHDSTSTNYVASAAQGPHGSAYQYLLRGPNGNNWPNLTLSTANFNASWCANCHNNSANGAHTSDHSSLRCYNCHVVVPHGGKMSRLIADRDGTMPDRYAWNNQTTNVFVQSFTKASGSYSDGNCRTSCGHHTAGSSTTMENW